MHLLKDNSVQKNQNHEAGTLCIGQSIGSASQVLDKNDTFFAFLFVVEIEKGLLGVHSVLACLLPRSFLKVPPYFGRVPIRSIISGIHEAKRALGSKSIN